MQIQSRPYFLLFKKENIQCQRSMRVVFRDFPRVKIPVDAKKLIKTETMPEKIEKLFLAIAI